MQISIPGVCTCRDGSRGARAAFPRRRFTKEKLTNYGHWDQMSLPAHSIIVQTCFTASIGGLDPDEVDPHDATRLKELQECWVYRFIAV